MKRYIPESLRARPIWVLWKIETDKQGRRRKIPYQPTSARARSDNETTWSSFDRVWSIYTRYPDIYQGIGIMLPKSGEIVFIDIDYCIIDNMPDDRANDLFDTVPKTYIERSQSGTGLHALMFGHIDKNFNNRETGVEMYSSGRFCAMTDDVVLKVDLSTNYQEGIDYFYNKYKKPDPVKVERNSIIGRSSRSDSWVTEKAMQDGKTSLLMEGNWNAAGYKSQSEADLALCGKLAFWSDADPGQVDRIFRDSGLYRDKWDREEYSQKTVEKACSQIQETYSEYIDRKQREEAKRLGRDRFFTVGSE